MKLASAESRYLTAAATSSGRPARPSGCSAHLVFDPGRRRGRLAGQEGSVALGINGPVRDGIHPDTARAVVHGQRPGQALDRGLGGRIRQCAADRPLRLVRGDVDDRAARPSSAEPADRGRAGCCQIAVSITMAYMLITML